MRFLIAILLVASVRSSLAFADEDCEGNPGEAWACVAYGYNQTTHPYPVMQDMECVDGPFEQSSIEANHKCRAFLTTLPAELQPGYCECNAVGGGDSLSWHH